MQREPLVPTFPAGARPTIDEVRLALVRLRGCGMLIRHRIERAPKSNQAALLASLDQVEEQILVLTDLLDAFEQATER